MTTPSASANTGLVTRSDFDGLVCAVLLKELDLIDDILFVHPADARRQDRDHRARHHHQLALRAGRTPGV